MFDVYFKLLYNISEKQQNGILNKVRLQQNVALRKQSEVENERFGTEKKR